MNAVAEQTVIRSECCLRIDDRGIPTLDIFEQKEDGEVFSYTVAPADAGLDDWACVLTRTDGAGDGPYRVAVNCRGKWFCECPDAFYRGRRRACKHTKNLAALKRFLDLLR